MPVAGVQLQIIEHIMEVYDQSCLAISSQVSPMMFLYLVHSTTHLQAVRKPSVVSLVAIAPFSAQIPSTSSSACLRRGGTPYLLEHSWVYQQAIPSILPIITVNDAIIRDAVSRRVEIDSI